MYLCIDVGGTKTLIAAFRKDGLVVEKVRIPTPKKYTDFITTLHTCISSMRTPAFEKCAIALPGKIDREQGIGVAFGNLDWSNVPIRSDLAGALGDIDILLENDANAAGLSEAVLLKDFKRVLYVTISTGIGTGYIVDGRIDPDMANSEGGHMVLEHEGRMQVWEKFASGRAIVARYGKPASEITDDTAWRSIAHNIALGLIELIVVIQPEVIVIGGGIGSHFAHYHKYVEQEISRYGSKLITIPPLKKAQRAEEAVLYGCYEMLKA